MDALEADCAGRHINARASCLRHTSTAGVVALRPSRKRTQPQPAALGGGGDGGDGGWGGGGGIAGEGGDGSGGLGNGGESGDGGGAAGGGMGGPTTEVTAAIEPAGKPRLVARADTSIGAAAEAADVVSPPTNTVVRTSATPVSSVVGSIVLLSTPRPAATMVTLIANGSTVRPAASEAGIIWVTSMMATSCWRARANR